MKTVKMTGVFLLAAIIFTFVFSNMVVANAASMIYCPNCGRQIDAKSHYCLYCGESIPAFAYPETSSVQTPYPPNTSLLQVGDTVTFGSYEQDNNFYNGKEEIEWYVIAKEGNKVKLLSKYALDCIPFNKTWIEVTWEYCSLRGWLNDTFFNEAFSYSEKDKIVDTIVNADRNPDYKTDPGHGTMDKVFLLSINEFQYLPGNMKTCLGTAYCYAQGAYKPTNGNCYWWLRTPGWYNKSAADVNNNGISNYDEHLHKGYNVNHSGHAVRPVIWVNYDN